MSKKPASPRKVTATRELGALVRAIRKEVGPEQQKVTSTRELGALVRAVRKEAGLDQASAAGLAGVGTRFLGDIERGKPTVQLGLVLQVLARFGLEVTVARRGGRGA